MTTRDDYLQYVQSLCRVSLRTRNKVRKDVPKASHNGVRHAQAWPEVSIMKDQFSELIESVQLLCWSTTQAL